MNDAQGRISTQLKQRFASEVLWHFVSREKNETESYRILLSILRSGLNVGKQKEAFKFVRSRDGKMDNMPGLPVCCLADIPLKDLHIHAERYGKFAIGFHKENAIKEGFNPVLYMNNRSSIFAKFLKKRETIAEALAKKDPDLRKKFDELLCVLSSVSKSGDLMTSPSANPKLDITQLNNFYYEREWRSIREWNFKSHDVALILLPKSKLQTFTLQRKKGGLRVSETTPVLPFDLIYHV